MKKRLTQNILIMFLIALGSYQSFAQRFELEIRTVAVDDYTLGVEMRDVGAGPAPTTNDRCLDINFAIKWEIDAMADLSGPISTTYNMHQSGPKNTKGGYEYQGFWADPINFFFPTNWVTNEWTQIMQLDITIGGSGEFDFEMVEVGFDEDFDPNMGIEPSGESFDDYEPAINGFASLDFQLEEFTARTIDEKSALLEWKAIVDQEASHFDIERSVLTNDWTKIGKVEVTNSYNNEAEFTYLDENVYSPEGNYDVFRYRLKMVNVNGEFEYSPVRQVRFRGNNAQQQFEVNAYPNPTSDVLFLEIPFIENQEQVEIQISSISGKQVMQESLLNARGLTHKLNLQYLSQGLHHVKITTAGKDHYFPIVVIK